MFLLNANIQQLATQAIRQGGIVVAAQVVGNQADDNIILMS